MTKAEKPDEWATAVPYNAGLRAADGKDSNVGHFLGKVLDTGQD